MKTLTMNLMTAAALMVVAGSASAQTMRAEIPFAFNVGNSRMTPGTYRVSLRGNNAGVSTIQFFNLETAASVIQLGGPGKDVPRDWVANGRGVLTFACTGSYCYLQTVWGGTDNRTLRAPAPTAKKDFAGAQVINIPLAKAD